MNKMSIYQNIIETYNIPPNSYVPFGNLQTENEIMKMIFSNYISNTVYDKTNSDLKSMLDSYISTVLPVTDTVDFYDREDFTIETLYFDKNLQVINEYPFDNSLIVDFDVSKYATDSVKNALFYFDTVCSIYKTAYERHENDNKTKMEDFELKSHYHYNNGAMRVYRGTETLPPISQYVSQEIKEDIASITNFQQTSNTCNYLPGVNYTIYSNYIPGINYTNPVMNAVSDNTIINTSGVLVTNPVIEGFENTPPPTTNVFNVIITRSDDMKNEAINVNIQTIDVIKDIFNLFKGDILKHISYLEGDDIKYTDKYYIRSVHNFYRFCRLKLMYSILQNISLKAQKNNANELHLKISNYIKEYILPVFINFKEHIVIQTKSQPQSNKNSMYNNQVIQKTGDISKINEKIRKHKDTLEKNKKKSSGVDDSGNYTQLFHTIAIIVTILVAVFSTIFIMADIDYSAKSMSFVIMASVVMLIMIIMFLSTRNLPKVEETFSTTRHPIHSAKMNNYAFQDGTIIRIDASTNAAHAFKAFEFDNSSSSWTSFPTYTNGVANTEYKRGYMGEYIKIDFGAKIRLSNYNISFITEGAGPKTFRLYGSNNTLCWNDINHLSWTQIEENSNISYSSNTKSFTPSGVFDYRFYKIVVNRLTGNATSLNIGKWEMYGTLTSLEKSQILNSDINEANQKIQLATTLYNNSKALYDRTVAETQAIIRQHNQLKTQLQGQISDADKILQDEINAKMLELAQANQRLAQLEMDANAKLLQAVQKENLLQNTNTQISESINTTGTLNEDIDALNEQRNNLVNSLDAYIQANKTEELAYIALVEAEASLEIQKIIAENNFQSTKTNSMTLKEYLANDLSVKNQMYMREIASRQATKSQLISQNAEKQLELDKLNESILSENQHITMLNNAIETEIGRIATNNQILFDLQQNLNVANTTNDPSVIAGIISRVNQEYGRNYEEIKDTINFLETKIIQEKSIRDDLIKQYNDQENLRIELLTESTNITALIENIKTDIQGYEANISTLENTLQSLEDQLANATKLNNDLKEKKMNDSALFNANIVSAEKRILMIQTEKEKQISDLNILYLQNRIEETRLTLEAENKTKEALTKLTIRDNLRSRVSERLHQLNHLTTETDKETDRLQNYNFVYIVRDIDILILYNINDSINSVNFDIIIPLLNKEYYSYDKYENNLQSLVTHSTHDLNVKKVYSSDVKASTLLLLNFSVLIPGTLAISYMRLPLTSFVVYMFGLVIVLLIYDVQITSRVRTRSRNKYWIQPTTKLSKL